MRADSGESRSSIWFSTPPLDSRHISKAARIQLAAESHDQGWCSDPSQGSWSWFEVVILAPPGDDGQTAVIKKGSDGRDLVWTSHTNPLRSDGFAWRKGKRFESDHEIWRQLAEGDSIGVRVCAQYPGWKNTAKEGVLNVDEWLEPIF